MDEENAGKRRGVRSGEAFYHDNPDTRTLRLSYSTVSEAGLLTAVERLAASL
jgi:DNA-binding transcriptional MocR family regulator